MRNNLIFPLLLTAAIVSTVSAQVPKVHYAREIGRPEVTATGIWEKVAAPGMNNTGNTPPGMLAYAVAENNCIFNWTPSADTTRLTGQADIIGALLSPDESLLMIAERVGGANKNNSTRLIFLNLLNNRICGGMDIPERRITKLLDLPGSNGAFLAFQEGQSVFSNGNALLFIDIRKKKFRQIGQDINDKISDICTDGSKVWFAIEGKNQICELDLDDPFKLRYCDTKKPVLKLAVNPASNSVIALENGFCEFYSVTRNGLYLESSIEFPENYQPVWMMSVSNRGNTAVAVDAEGKGFLISAGGLVALNGRIATHGCPLPDGTILLGTVERYPKLNNITLPGGEVKSYITPSTLRPSSRNKTLAVFARTGNPQECIQIDERGNVFRLILQGRRGRKNTILIVNKTGLR